MNMTTLSLTKEQYTEIITTLRTGYLNCRPNPRVAMALILEANLGIRISDIVQLTLNSIVKDGEQYRLDIAEQKTGKKRTFFVPVEIYQFIKSYCYDNGIKPNECIIPITPTAIRKQLRGVCDYLGYEKISTHSFRKFFAHNSYENGGHDIEAVRELLQHSNVKTTQNYLKTSQEKINDILKKNICLL